MTTIISITDLPRECIDDCSTPGQAADEPVGHWRRDPVVGALLDGLDDDAMRECLRAYGAWDDEELADDEQNRQRVLWLACGDFSEYIAECEDAGVDPFGECPEDFEPGCGSDIFCLE